MSTDKITFLTNWYITLTLISCLVLTWGKRAKVAICRHATPYHAPLYLAQSKGFFAEQGLKVALLEPNDPSDVTEIIGSGKVDMGFKAMIHTLAVRPSN